jgi:acetyl-CoA synthetase
MADQKKHIEYDDLLREDRTFSPPAEFTARAHVRDKSIYAEAERDPEAFWASFASELEWSRPWDKVLDWQPPHAKWFVGGQLNASVNCLDRHVRGSRRNKAALIWEGEPGDKRTLTYFDLHRDVCRFANVLKSLDFNDTAPAAIYTPLVPELAIAMLACARIGAIHSVVFGASVPSRSAIASSTSRRSCSSRPTAAIAAGRSSSSSRSPTRPFPPHRRSRTSWWYSVGPARARRQPPDRYPRR